MYNQEMLIKIQLIFLDRHCSEVVLAYYYHFLLFYHFLVWHNRMLNLGHKVNKLLNYWNKY